MIKKSFLYFCIFIIAGCSSELFLSSNKSLFIPLQPYSKEEQKQIKLFLKENNNQTIEKIIIDYFSLREVIRINNK